MVRDFMLDMAERDLLLEDKSNIAMPVFDSVWGNIFPEDEEIEVLICNVIIPEAYWSLIKYGNDELICRFTAEYKPDIRYFRVRLVALKNGQYTRFSNIRGEFGLPVSSFALTKNIASPISASMLPYIDVDGAYLVRMVRSPKDEILDKAYIYSGKSSDICVSYSDDQASQLLSLCAPGKSYRYPTTGCGITGYLNCVVAHSNLQEVLETQFDADNKPIKAASFDSETCNLDVLFQPEKEESDDNLESIDNLNLDFFGLFTDEYVRRNVVLTELSDSEFLELLNNYENVLNLIMFEDNTTTISRIANKVEEGRLDAEGNILPDDKYFVVSATLEANTIIMFDDKTEDKISDAPVFIINDHDESRLYTALVEQPYWITDTCHKCFILKKRATVKYMIRKDQFRLGKGLYMVPPTSANIKNLLGLVQDKNTGRLLGIVSNNTNISDMTMDEITQHIYATQITD